MAKITARVEAGERRVTQLHQLYQELKADQMELRETVKKETTEISQKLEQLFRKLEVTGRSNPSSSHGGEGSSHIEFPRFNGQNPVNWIGKCRRYFSLCRTPENEKVLLASMHMEGKAEFFYLNYVEGRGDIGWKRFSEMVAERFGDRRGDNVYTALHKLRQEGSVEMYVEQFEELKACLPLRESTTPMDEYYFVECFLNGLKEEIRDVLQSFHPTTLTWAINLAKYRENDLEQMVDESDEEEEVEVQERSDELAEDSKALFLSVAVADEPNPNVVKGWVKKDSISIILVSASTHSFLDPQAAKRLGCKIEQTKRFPVTFAGGSEIECNSKCSGFEWEMGFAKFSADVRIMKLDWYGCDLVLGVDFFKRMASIVFWKRTITITHEGKEVVLKTRGSR
ncbi:PREDICTED: uncharacterized protein LOC105958843 [Erythranthe guttata]|uniref:uncharacterized protein LOC105958843 n=1 Tax=Erythranthe guttata TaxID=4155 RepID=UPI00064DBA67|nr:PREDICTED: uncharacterized protein LOC105958843 [Erythranthe guttata]|eukprot:XP_012838300.1 PREDICTED: uncharacterized protein LOC105958843 [Erythranthe guttata]